LSCELAEVTIHGYFDGELDAVRAAEFQHHLESCDECKTSLAKMSSLRASLRDSRLYERASANLETRVRKELKLTSGGLWRSRSLLISRFWVPAFAILVVAAGFLFFLTSSRSGSARLTAELIDAHVRSLQPGHVMDVQSTDQHTVKPWFDGKLDFIPPVTDYAERGFPLLGGRLDVLDGHNVAGLVYGRRKHIINLFVWPAHNGAGIRDTSGSHQGYNWTMWQSGDMDYSLVSDASAADLRELRDLIQHQQP